MTDLLQRAFLLASLKPEEEQNALALVLLDGLADEVPSVVYERAGATGTVNEPGAGEGDAAE